MTGSQSKTGPLERLDTIGAVLGHADSSMVEKTLRATLAGDCALRCCATYGLKDRNTGVSDSAASGGLGVQTGLPAPKKNNKLSGDGWSRTTYPGIMRPLLYR